MPADQSVQSMFTTHNNYVRCLSKHVNGLTISTPLNPSQSLPISKLAKFSKLSEMTHESIRNEVAACFDVLEYTQVVAPWMPVKCYYRLYYLEAMMLYLLNGSEVGFFNGGHSGVRKSIKSLIENGDLVFSSSAFSQRETIGDALNHTIISGSNLSPTFFETEECTKSLRKKIAQYAEHDFKEKERIKNYLSRSNRDKRDIFYANKSVNITDFFYWMRIKANYKDTDYLDFANDIYPSDAYMYVMRYATAQESYAYALKDFINKLKATRSMD
jgi:hypothetical protein